MPKTAYLKRRNGASRERYAQNRYLAGLAEKVAAKYPTVIERTDADGATLQLTRRQMRDEIRFSLSSAFQKIPRFAPYTGADAILDAELERGAVFYFSGSCYELKKLY